MVLVFRLFGLSRRFGLRGVLILLVLLGQRNEISELSAK